MKQQEAVRVGQTQSLKDSLTTPENPTTLPAVLFLNAGKIHRVGPSRIYVRLARRLAALGFPSLRFDFSGIGDSCARTDSLSLEKAFVDDVQQAMDYLMERLGSSEFILIGHCGGAWVAFLCAGVDERVRGAILMNPEGAEENWVEYDRQRKLSRYYENYYTREALVDPQRWKKLLTGKADYRSIFETVVKSILWNRIRTLSFKLRHKVLTDGAPKEPTQQQQRILAEKIVNAFIERQMGLLLLFSKGSTSVEHAHTVIGKPLKLILQNGIATEIIIPNADHMFTTSEGQQAMIHHVENWCDALVERERPESSMV